MRILVFGASGHTGQVLVRQAVARGHQVTAFVRDPAKAPTKDSDVRTIVGNVADDVAVADAIVGQDAVVSALGVGVPLKHDPEVIRGIQHIIRGMETHDVRRLVYVSFIGVHDSRAAVGFLLRYVAPFPLRHEIADHEAKEALVRESDLDWTIVRPPKLTGGARTGQYRSGPAISTWKPMPLLSREDLSDFILGELAEPRYVRRATRLLH